MAGPRLREIGELDVFGGGGGGISGIVVTDGVGGIEPVAVQIQFEASDGFVVFGDGLGNASVAMQNFGAAQAGNVPPSGGGVVNFLRADGSFSLPPLFTNIAPGYVPASGGGTVNFLRADGTWTDPGGGSIIPPGPGLVFTDGVDLTTEAQLQYDTTTNTIELNTDGPAFQIGATLAAGAFLQVLEAVHVSGAVYTRMEGADPSFNTIEVAGEPWSYGVLGAPGSFAFRNSNDFTGANVLELQTDSDVLFDAGSFRYDAALDAVRTLSGYFSGGVGIGVTSTAIQLDVQSATGVQAQLVSTGTSGSTDIALLTVGAQSTGGDPYMIFGIAAGQFFAVGSDNSVSGDPLKISSGAVLGTNDILTLDGARNVVLGSAALAVGAGDGFLYLPSCAGTPTGTPTSYSGRIPVVYDSAAKRLYLRDGASWLSALFS